ncbi:cupin domain-containing protein [Sphingobium subterraneum]|uniref:Mannose-6-phosphate isomerase-like protein (Cupin superfamily) n=1 Tax=Sphingobium subterraneum TaxID=627688 RepID=A0A841J008_9SPHN|nr:cupin domain-containing protein [Sphingobium subterraneum]MBB6123692.1 mannose-6-phosphate isomerase-like protein (cupin superfamily) [Sphingobium subterraneum]
MPKVAVVHLDALAPTQLDTPFHRDGLAVHKRAISRQEHGAERLDAGYNAYKAGISFAVPAAPVEGVCYILSGEGILDDGEQQTALRPGSFIFQPAGSAAHITISTDMESVCVFSPPRN